MNKTAIYLTSMTPCIIFGKYGWNFIFVDIKNNKYARSEDRQAGYSFRRFFTNVSDVSKLQDTSGDYPFEEFVKERAYMQKRGIV